MDVTEVEFGSLLAYVPSPLTEKGIKSKGVASDLKEDRMTQQGVSFSKLKAQEIRKNLKDLPFRDYFNSDAILVPAPNSSVGPSALWVPMRITTALVENGLGRSSEPCLQRIKKVPRSTGQTNSAYRPKPLRHYESMNVKRLPFEPKEIVLVDDVVTLGATILGGVNRLADAFPDAKIRAFAMMRVMKWGFVDVNDPCIGKITLQGKYADRKP